MDTTDFVCFFAEKLGFQNQVFSNGFIRYSDTRNRQAAPRDPGCPFGLTIVSPNGHHRFSVFCEKLGFQNQVFSIGFIRCSDTRNRQAAPRDSGCPFGLTIVNPN